jgi:uncharacterized protein with ATP-grasp and redox domains
LQRPAPLSTDGSNAFARYSMEVRVPRIARELVERNESLSPRVRDAVLALARGIEQDAPIPPPRPPAPDVEAWSAAHVEQEGASWLHAQWFHAELAFYREVAHLTRFWETESDPFEPAKEEELAGDRPWSRLGQALVEGEERPRTERIAALLDACLWGNRVDLSYAVAAAHGRGRPQDDLLVDDRATALPILTRPGAHVHLVADNTGTELALDVALVDALLEDAAARVTVHLKMQPVFVSDALPRDLWRLVDRMSHRDPAARALATRLRSAFDTGRMRVAPDPFWSGPRFLWQAPRHLAEELAAAAIVVLKGDANYRRLVGDALWPADAPFSAAASYLPFPVLCLRTMKSDSVLGLPTGLGGRLDASDPTWRIDGKRGLAQAFVPSGPEMAYSRSATR